MSSEANVEEQCAICLANECDNLALLNTCLHGFCLDCIHQWVIIGGNKCPLCKQSFLFLFYDIIAPTEYKIVYCDEFVEPKKRSKMELPKVKRFRMSINHHRRKLVYTCNMQTASLPGSMKKDWSPQRFASGSKDNDSRIRHWVTRELQAVCEKDDVRILCAVVLALLKKCPLVSSAFHSELYSYLFDRCEMFIHELRTFLLLPNCTTDRFDLILKVRELERRKLLLQEQKESQTNDSKTNGSKTEKESVALVCEISQLQPAKVVIDLTDPEPSPDPIPLVESSDEILTGNTEMSSKSSAIRENLENNPLENSRSNGLSSRSYPGVGSYYLVSRSHVVLKETSKRRRSSRHSNPSTSSSSGSSPGSSSGSSSSSSSSSSSGSRRSPSQSYTSKKRRRENVKTRKRTLEQISDDGYISSDEEIIRRREVELSDVISELTVHQKLLNFLSK